MFQKQSVAAGYIALQVQVYVVFMLVCAHLQAAHPRRAQGMLKVRFHARLPH
jgi:hypothetical protein